MTELCCAWLFAAPAYAGAWTPRGGEGQVISTSSWSHAGKIYDDDFEAQPLRGFTKTEMRLYLEHGLSDDLTLVANGAFQSLNFRDEDSRFDYDGLDDLEIGLQLNTPIFKKAVTAIRASYVFDSRLDNEAIDVLGGGDQMELRALIGQSFETARGDYFYDAQLALRTEDFGRVDAMQGHVTLGYKPTRRWLAMVQSTLNYAQDEVVDGFPVPEQTQLNAQISIARQYKPGRYVQLGTGRTLTGQNIVQERSVFIGLWTEY